MCIQQLFENNRAWSEAVHEKDPEYFKRLAAQQSPEYLWIGCSDSRVPANQIIGLAPGEVFVHRNIANVVVHTDLNCLSVINYAVDVLKVKHILVVGHYGCGGVRGALSNQRLGVTDNWLRHVQDVRDKHIAELEGIEDFSARVDRLCELNVIEQVVNVCQTTMCRVAWERGQELTVHGWVYSLKNGLVNDMKVSVSNTEEADAAYRANLRSWQLPR